LTAKSQRSPALLRLRVQPNAIRNEVAGFTEGVLLVKIAAPPVRGKANQELIAFLSQALGVAKGSLSLVKGHTSRNKVIAVEGLNHDEAVDRLFPKPSSSSSSDASRR